MSVDSNSKSMSDNYYCYSDISLVIKKITSGNWNLGCYITFIFLK